MSGYQLESEGAPSQPSQADEEIHCRKTARQRTMLDKFSSEEKHKLLISSVRLAIWAFKPRFVWRRCSTRRRTSPLTTGGAPGPGATVAIGGGTMAAPLRCGEEVIGAIKDEPGDW